MKFNTYCLKKLENLVHQVIFYNEIDGIAQLSSPIKKEERLMDLIIGDIGQFINEHRDMKGLMMVDGKSKLIVHRRV